MASRRSSWLTWVYTFIVTAICEERLVEVPNPAAP
jgi:hypothetical protein